MYQLYSFSFHDLRTREGIGLKWFPLNKLALVYAFWIEDDNKYHVRGIDVRGDVFTFWSDSAESLGVYLDDRLSVDANDAHFKIIIDLDSFFKHLEFPEDFVIKTQIHRNE